MTVTTSSQNTGNGSATTLTFLDRVPVEEITRQAKQARPGKAVLQLIGAFFFLAGWLAAGLARFLTVCGAWCYVATRSGWRTARGEDLDQPSLEVVLAENARLRKEAERMDQIVRGFAVPPPGAG